MWISRSEYCFFWYPDNIVDFQSYVSGFMCWDFETSTYLHWEIQTWLREHMHDQTADDTRDPWLVPSPPPILCSTGVWLGTDKVAHPNPSQSHRIASRGYTNWPPVGRVSGSWYYSPPPPVRSYYLAATTCVASSWCRVKSFLAVVAAA